MRLYRGYYWWAMPSQKEKEELDAWWAEKTRKAKEEGRYPIIKLPAWHKPKNHTPVSIDSKEQQGYTEGTISLSSESPLSNPRPGGSHLIKDEDK